MDDRTVGLIQRAAAKLKQPSKIGPTVVRKTPSDGQGLSTEGLFAVHSDRPEVVREPDVIVDRGRLAQAGIGFPEDQRSRLAEEFRVIKRQILAATEKLAQDDRIGRARVILVTSARPFEGKTFVSANLSLAIASERDCRVLAIDCDPMRQTLGTLLGVGANSGLGDLLHGDKTEISEILFHTNIHNLNVIPFGKQHADMPELLSSKRMTSILQEMGRRYSDRYIILDAPPCLAASDASILAPLVGQIVFVVEANRTQQQEIEEALRLVSACPNISLVLNKTDGSSPEQFGSHGYY